MISVGVHFMCDPQKSFNSTLAVVKHGILSEEILYRQYFVFDNFITFELKILFDRTRCPSVVTYTLLKCPVPALLELNDLYQLHCDV